MKNKHRGWNGHRNTGKEPWSFKKGMIPWNRGKKFSRESRSKMSIAKKGRKMTDAQKRKISATLKGKRPKNFGKDFGTWKGGITPIHRRLRTTLEYRLWRNSVFERDNYTCRFCGVRGGILNADHIKPFALFPELRFAIDNGRTLCISCHKKTDTYGYKSSSKYEQ